MQRLSGKGWVTHATRGWGRLHDGGQPTISESGEVAGGLRIQMCVVRGGRLHRGWAESAGPARRTGYTGRDEANPNPDNPHRPEYSKPACTPEKRYFARRKKCITTIILFKVKKEQ